MKLGNKVTFLQKLLITYLIVLIIPILIMGRQTLSDYQKAFEEEILQINADMLEEISEVINLKMREMETITVNLDANPVLRPYEVKLSPYGAIRAIQALAQYRSTNSFIYELGYYIRGGDYIYTSIVAYDKQSFFKYFLKREGYDDSELNRLIEECDMPVILPSGETEFLNKKMRMLICLYPMPMVQGGHYATAIFLIDEAQIVNLVKSIFHRMNGNMVIYDIEGQPLLALTDTQVPDFSWVAALMPVQNGRENETVSTILDFNGERTAATLIGAGYRGFSYLSLTSLNKIMEPAQKLRQRFFLIMFAVFTGGCLIILASMNITYKPIQNLFLKAKASFDPVAEDGASGGRRVVYNEIAYIDEILERVNHDNKMMKYALQDKQKDTRIVFLMDLLNGMIVDAGIFKQRSKLADVATEGRLISVIILLPEEPSSAFDKELLDELENYMSTLCGFYPLITVGEHTVPVLLTIPEDAAHSMEKIIGKIYGFFEQKKIIVTIGAGMLYSDPLQAQVSFHQAMDALSHRFIAGKGSVITFESLTQKDNQFFWYPKEEIDSLIRCITAGDAEGICNSINSVVREIKKRNMSIFAARCLCYDLINTAVKVVVSYNVSLEVMEQQLKNIICLPQTETIQQLSEYLIDFCTNLSDHLTNMKNNYVEKILAYIDQHYRSCNFSVYNMAEELGISYSYMNRLFHAYSNQTILEYITEKRMDLIKELLRTTELPIKEIILSAGYNDIPNCSRKFKQREGISLRQYRQRMRETG